MRERHGHATRKGETPEYQVWVQLKMRCLNPKHADYKNYGGRGITVCERWMTFENFLADMGTRPSNNHSIDRKDNDKGYCKENCRWATRTEQNQNRRRAHNAAYVEGKPIKEWAEEKGISLKAAYQRTYRQAKAAAAGTDQAGVACPQGK